MNPRSVRSARRGLLALGVVLVVWVTWSLRRPVPLPPSPVSASPGAGGTTTTDIVIRKFKEGRESLVLQAHRMVGKEQEELRLEGVTVTFSYLARGEPGVTTVSSDECIYTPTIEKAVFQGHVWVRTADGAELRTESLVYRGDKELAKSEHPVEFKRKDVSGTATGVLYQADAGKIELPADVRIRVEDPDRPPTEIRSGRAIVIRSQGEMRFLGGVEVTQGRDRLTAERLLVNFGEEGLGIYRAQAVGGVDLRTQGGGVALAGAMSAGGSGPRRLTAKKLDTWYRTDRSLERAEAWPDAELTLLPGPGEPRERRRLAAKRVLVFRFDEAGRLAEVEGLKETSFKVEPLAPSSGALTLQSMRSQTFLARIDPATGAARGVDLNRDVELIRGRQRATAEKAHYEGPTSLLQLRDGAEVVGEDDGSHLSAKEIDIGTLSGDIQARSGVRHVLKGKGSGGSVLLGTQDTPTVVTCRLFDYQAKARTAWYREAALLRSGADEVRAPEIRLQEDASGSRRLTAKGGVASVLSPRAEKPGSVPAAPVEARAADMVYEESRQQVVYTGDVAMRQGDISTKSPKATLNLSPDGARILSLVAGEPVEVRQGDRIATGARGTYTPENETMVLVGEKVVFKNPGQEVQGRSLTFHVGDDRILVDGREEVRTQAIFKKEPPKP